MKKSRIAKLALMGASITALAATLTTSTYAWYVSNREANVAKTEASTGSANADSSVLLSWSSGANFGKEINFTDSPNHPVLTSLAFQPVHEYEGSFYGVAADYYSRATTASTNLTHYLQFTLYAKTESADGVDVTVNFTINNKTTVSSDLNQIAMVPAAKGAPTGIAQGSPFYKDCIDAMYIRQSYPTTDSTTTETLAATTLLGTSTLTNGKAADGNAHTYYKEVQGWYDATLNDNAGGYTHNLWAEEDPAVTTSLTAFSQIHLTTTALAITYTIWLDGGDTDCFNSCANQTIDFAIKYTVA